MIKAKPAVSIILPTYNRADTLPRAIESVIAQDFTNWELIIVDDGSTDKTAEICQKYSAKNPQIKYEKIVKSGTVTARTRGLSLMSAPLATFLDSDDYYAPGHLKTNLSYLSAHPDLDMIHGFTTVIGNPYVTDVLNRGEKLHIDECCAHGTFFIREHVIKAIKPLPDYKYGEDYHLLQKILASGFKVEKTPDRTYVYDRTNR